MNRVKRMPSLSCTVVRCFGHKPSVVDDEQFMNLYYDSTSVPKESELDPEEFKTRLESWFAFISMFMFRSNYKMFTGVKMRKNGDWFAFYDDHVEGTFYFSLFVVLS